MALDCIGGKTRLEWDGHDLLTPEGRIEVKSAAYLQSWEQKELSRIVFDIKPAEGWDHATNTHYRERTRRSEAYVFCLLKHKDKATVDPLNLDQWEFYVMATSRLTAAVGNQKTISRDSLRKHQPANASFANLREHVAEALQQSPLTNRASS
ncbi:hypothetical protein F4561_002058 [Lipingzhangella halophila]|uniref:Uncharacterized protein n=1 Tax=Lipingzhangella halophila TaxID=1783352 RepID=A0A7W7RGJ6_9ACTN|nr:hypothetical protein [Lipingzhangella halophila]MBB4931238.1 hypothetical protein [Lipingzhangella halophila]